MDKNIIGSAGEFLVAAEISRRGCIATLTLKNTPLIDVIATNPKNDSFARIQVKTRSADNNQGWLLNKKVESETESKNMFYVFVNLGSLKELPEYFIIPFNILANYIKKNHSDWLKGCKKDGTPHNDSNIRAFKPDSTDKEFGDKYKNNWGILDIF